MKPPANHARWQRPGRTGLRLLAVAVAYILLPFGSVAAQENRDSIRGTNLEIPRFVTLQASRANMRAGPGKDYPIKWQYRRVGLPLKVVGEFEIWRKVEDHEGETGWMNVNMLTILRMGLILDTTAPIHSDDSDSSPVIAVAEHGVILELKSCGDDWCKVAGEGVQGWIRRSSIWGLLEGEALD